jgi:hypothetical protein
MASPKAKPSTLRTWLANPAVPYLVAAVVVWLLLRFAVPDLWKNVTGGLRKGLDSLFSELASIVGPPESQELAKRSSTDQVKGLVVEGDRSLSDLVDEPGTFFKKVFGII